MKYTTPIYENESVETRDIIALSVEEAVKEEVNPENPNDVSYSTNGDKILGI